ncbi:MAG: hypothetical protein WBQ78_06415, partial [Gammaproteobacteria bacterium]
AQMDAEHEARIKEMDARMEEMRKASDAFAGQAFPRDDYRAQIDAERDARSKEMDARMEEVRKASDERRKAAEEAHKARMQERGARIGTRQGV